jgi:hypothetical protein
MKFKKREPLEIAEQIKPQDLDAQTKVRLQRFISENERITNEAKDLNDKLSFYIDNEKRINCSVQFDSKTGIPYIKIKEYSEYRSNNIDIKLSQFRNMLTWLKNLGIE